MTFKLRHQYNLFVWMSRENPMESFAFKEHTVQSVSKITGIDRFSLLFVYMA